MELTGEQRIPASQGAVWAALNDPAVLKTCIPGCDSIERQSDNEYRVSMLAAVGPIKARFHGRLAINDADPPRAYSLSFEGSGGAAGFGRGSASVALAPADDGTLLAYTANAEVTGKLAQVGSRLIDGVAKKMAAEFFHRFKGCFAEGQSPRPSADGHPVCAAPEAAVLPARPGKAAGADLAPVLANDSPPSATVRDILRELRVWQAIAVVAIASACLAIGYIIGAH
ncbi:CoxG family protein [Bordetella sp. H567]|uniref:CoxG family protein n=1 Tax=Bordetella sp. H567 TaxID=1697043 RepID=UPI000976F152|nr:carbon monoxide dehydrogenase subunit G [Bordetella sp. H567]